MRYTQTLVLVFVLWYHVLMEVKSMDTFKRANFNNTYNRYYMTLISKISVGLREKGIPHAKINDLVEEGLYFVIQKYKDELPEHIDVPSIQEIRQHGGY